MGSEAEMEMSLKRIEQELLRIEKRTEAPSWVQLPSWSQAVAAGGQGAGRVSG